MESCFSKKRYPFNIEWYLRTKIWVGWKETDTKIFQQIARNTHTHNITYFYIYCPLSFFFSFPSFFLSLSPTMNSLIPPIPIEHHSKSSSFLPLHICSFLLWQRGNWIPILSIFSALCPLPLYIINLLTSSCLFALDSQALRPLATSRTGKGGEQRYIFKLKKRTKKGRKERKVGKRKCKREAFLSVSMLTGYTVKGRY